MDYFFLSNIQNNWLIKTGIRSPVGSERFKNSWKGQDELLVVQGLISFNKKITVKELTNELSKAHHKI